MTSIDVFDDYRTHLLAAGRGTGTVQLRLKYLNKLREQHPDLLAVTLRDLESYLATRRTTHAAETRKSMRSSFRSFYAWAHAEGHIPTDPAFKLAPIRIPTTVPRLAPDEAVSTALETATPHERAILLLGRQGCLRRAEIASLHMRDRDRNRLYVTGKGEKQRLVPCPPDLLAALIELEQHQDYGYYFPGRIRGHVHMDHIYRVITSLTGCNPHSLRHAGATASYNATHNIRSVQQLLGHTNISTTERYLHVDENDLWAAAMGTAFTGPAA